MRRRLALIAVLALLLGVAAFLLVPGGGGKPVQADGPAPRIGAPGSPRSLSASVLTIDERREAWLRALARAYAREAAALGAPAASASAAADLIHPTDPDAVAEAVRLRSEQHAIRQEPRAISLGGAMPVPAMSAAGSGGAQAAAASSSGPEIIPTGPIHIGPERLPQPIVETRGRRDIVVRDAYAMLRHHPDEGRELLISDQGGGVHAIDIRADDYGGVRVNGGLVAPGRYYKVEGEMRIESDVPLRILVRPLANVGEYFDKPAYPPQGPG